MDVLRCGDLLADALHLKEAQSHQQCSSRALNLLSGNGRYSSVSDNSHVRYVKLLLPNLPYIIIDDF